ncbi:hypothetical protein INT48_000076 [Thamnidium elegans]|uniref:Uncharacterized protein n=1 Tax=Thamnidium elegans TaxID=101142 RepID=A0A8H7VZC4_9FUNG|nr:hypothetical protein INT48_000076 [Thamnidium elegans]
MDQYFQDIPTLQDFNMGSSGTLSSFSIPSASTQSSFNSYQAPYNSSEYIHISRVEEIVIKYLESIDERVVERIVERAVERAVEKLINRILTATSENVNVPAP